jgi:nitrite reductase/ring-hydroxylating ferredoxin subunit
VRRLKRVFVPLTGDRHAGSRPADRVVRCRRRRGGSPGSLADGTVDGEEVECPFHQGRFHIPTGQPTAPPCTEKLRVWPARVIDGRICIDRE